MIWGNFLKVTMPAKYITHVRLKTVYQLPPLERRYCQTASTGVILAVTSTQIPLHVTPQNENLKDSSHLCRNLIRTGKMTVVWLSPLPECQRLKELIRVNSSNIVLK